MSRDLKKGTDRIQKFAEKLISEVKRILGLNLLVLEVDRPFDVHVAYYAQGREALEVVNKLRKRVGLYPITEQENKKKITWTMSSNHITNLEDASKMNDVSRAVDIGLKDKNGRYVTDANADINKDGKIDFKQIGIIGKMIDPGMIWGGDWKGSKYDPQHWEEPKGVSPILKNEMDSVTARDELKV